MASILILNEKLLPSLAQAILHEDQYNFPHFDSTFDKTAYLNMINSSSETVVKLVNDGIEFKKKYEDDKVQGPIADQMFTYLLYCLNCALQTIPNYSARKSYLDKISDSFQSCVDALEDLDIENEVQVASVENEVVQHKEAMLACTKMYKSNASKNYSRGLKESGTKFEELLVRQQAALRFEGSFEKLEDGQKLKVYANIVKESNRGIINVDELKEIKKGIGKGLLLYKVGSLVWDIFSDDHTIPDVVGEAMHDAASYAGAELGTVIGEALATQALVGVEATELFVFMAGTLGGIAGGFIVAAAVDLLLDAIFDSGGNVPTTQGFKCIVPKMPDGVTLARQLAHDHPEDVIH